MADINNIIDELNNTADSTQEFDPQDIESNKVFAILAYLSWLVLIPLFVAGKSKFARFHCNQGIVLAIAELLIGFILGVLKKLPLIGWIFGIAGSLLGIICLIFALIGILNAASGKAKDLPIVGNIRLIK